jgi:hypothetical protein
MPVYGLEWLVATFQWQILARLADKAFKVYMPDIFIIYEIRLLIGLRRESIRARKPFLLHHLGKSEIQTLVQDRSHGQRGKCWSAAVLQRMPERR